MFLLGFEIQFWILTVNRPCKFEVVLVYDKCLAEEALQCFSYYSSNGKRPTWVDAVLLSNWCLGVLEKVIESYFL